MMVEETMNTTSATLRSTSRTETMHPLKISQYLHKKDCKVLWSDLAGTSS